MPAKRKTEHVPPPTHFVGIGVSAGGLEAIEAFFKNMPAKPQQLCNRGKQAWQGNNLTGACSCPVLT